MCIRDRAWVIQVISPISLKLGRFKVSILKLKILKRFTFFNFPGGDRPPPLLFSYKGQKLSCLKHQKQIAAAQRECISSYCYWIQMIIRTLAFYLRSFSSLGCTDVNQALPKLTRVTQSVTNWQNTSYFRSKNLQWATFILQTIFITVNTHPWPCNIKSKIFGIC